MQGIVTAPGSNWRDGVRASPAARVHRYFEVVQIIASRTLQTRYRGSVLGVFWSLSNPILMTGIYALIFGTAFASYYDGSVLKYVAATFVGLAVLSVFAGTTSQALTSIVSNGGLLNKVRLPVSIFPVANAAANFFQFFIGTFALLIIITAIETRSVVNVIALFVPAIGLILLTIGVSLLTSSLYVYFRDLPYMYEMVLFGVWITSPIFYPAKLVPPRIRAVLVFNPVVSIVSSFRQIVLSKGAPDLALMGYAVLAGVTVFAIGAIAFRFLKRDFMDLL